MARGLNKVLLIGNLGADPEIKYAPSGTAIASFNIATSENRKNAEGEWEEKTEWHRIILFGKSAETCKDFLHKGSKIYLEGRLQTRSWEDQNGQRQYMTEVVGSQFLMLDGRGDGGEGGHGGQGGGPSQGRRQGQALSGGGRGAQSAHGPKGGSQGGRRAPEPPEAFPEQDDDLPF